MSDNEPVFELLVDPSGDRAVYVDHVIAHLREDVVETLINELRAHPDVEAVYHEDREKLVVRSRRKLLRRRLTEAELERTVAAFFARYDTSELYPDA